VRMAIEYAIDKQAIANAIGFGTAFPTYQLLQFHKVGEAPNLEYRKFDVAKAKQLLTEAGFPNGFKTKLTPQPINVSTDAMAMVQAYLKTIGIQAEIEAVEQGKYTDYRYKGWEDGFMVHLFAGYANPNQMFKFYFAGDTWPSLNFPDGFRDLYKATLRTATVEKDKVQALSKLIFDDCMIIPLNQTKQGNFIVGVHDMGTGKWGDGVMWSPDTAWKEAITKK